MRLALLAAAIMASLLPRASSRQEQYAWSLVAATAPPQTMHPGEKVTLAVVVRNDGTQTWLADAPAVDFPVRLGASAPRERTSAFGSADPTWLWSGGKRIRMTTPVVPPAGIGAFAFTFTAPELGAYPQTFTERFAPVAEGAAWMDDHDVAFTVTVRPVLGAVPPVPNPPVPQPSLVPPGAPGYAWSLIAATAPPQTMHPGEKVALAVAVRNEGTKTWLADVPGVATPVRLGASAPRERASAFGSADPTWLWSGGTRIRLGTPAVPPGSVGTFAFTFTAPVLDDYPQTYTERFAPVAEGVAWMDDHDVAFTVTVRPLLAALPPIPNPPLPQPGPPCLPTGPDGNPPALDPADLWPPAVAAGYSVGTSIADAELASPRAIAVDPLGKLVIADSGADRVVRMDPSGNVLFSWGGSGSGNGLFSAPSGVAVSTTGRIYVADTGNHRIQVFTLSGSYLGQFGGLSSPHRLTIPSTGPLRGSLVVADTGNDRVQVLTQSGQPLATVGGPGRFLRPAAVSVYGAHLYVADTGNNRVQKLTLNGEPVSAWGGAGGGPGCTNAPAGVVANELGVFVSDGGNQRLHHFTRGGQLLETWGEAGGVLGPQGLALESAGNVWVAESLGGRIKRFAPGAEAAPPVPCPGSPFC